MADHRRASRFRYSFLTPRYRSWRPRSTAQHRSSLEGLVLLSNSVLSPVFREGNSISPSRGHADPGFKGTVPGLCPFVLNPRVDGAPHDESVQDQAYRGPVLLGLLVLRGFLLGLVLRCFLLGLGPRGFLLGLVPGHFLLGLLRGHFLLGLVLRGSSIPEGPEVSCSSMSKSNTIMITKAITSPKVSPRTFRLLCRVLSTAYCIGRGKGRRKPEGPRLGLTLPAVEAGGLPITTSATTLHPDKQVRSPEPRTTGFWRPVVGDAGVRLSSWRLPLPWGARNRRDSRLLLRLPHRRSLALQSR